MNGWVIKMKHDTPLDDFHMTLGELEQQIRLLIQQHGSDAIVYPDAGYNNVSVFVETEE